jgi:hypothetical protein
MLAHILVAIVLAASGCTQSEQSVSGAIETSYRVYEGAWFRILYPANFTPRPSLVSTSAKGHDSVFFRSPDGSVELYVCSPQWGRTTPDIALIEAMEKLVSEERVERGIEVARNWTIVARNGSYTRFYEEIASTDGTTRQVFGFRYTDEATRERYAPVYTKFKESLEKYAD